MRVGKKSEYGALPLLEKRGLRDCQYNAEIKFEASVKLGNKKNLAVLATGSGKTYLAYAVSIHKAQGLEYDLVKVIITREVDERITHNIFYTAITQSKRLLKIYWSPETQERVINSFELSDNKRDATIFAAQTGLKMVKMRGRRNKEQVNR